MKNYNRMPEKLSLGRSNCCKTSMKAVGMRDGRGPSIADVLTGGKCG